MISFKSFRDVLEVNGNYYLLDMRYTADHGNECMAFPCSSTGDVQAGWKYGQRMAWNLQKKSLKSVNVSLLTI